MANTSFFEKVPVKVQKKSGFDLSFQNLLTTKVGTITPVLCEELIPNETIHLRAAIQAQLPPLASDTFMRCDLRYEAFFVPHRLVMNGYEEWLVPKSEYGASSLMTDSTSPRIPQVALTTAEAQPGTLADYLGFRSAIAQYPSSGNGYNITSASTAQVTALPFLAYHRIYDDWYRNTLVQNSIYRTPGLATSSSYASVYGVANAKFVTPSTNRGYILNFDGSVDAGNAGNKKYIDGVKVTELRQRNFGIDRFTSSTPSAQNGSAAGLSMIVSEGTAGVGSAGFTIGQLRAANSIQMFLERNNLTSNNLVGYVKANYNANLSEGVAQRAILLGSGKFAVYSKGIYNSTNEPADGNISVNNPFGSVGAQYGSAFASGAETIVDSFTAMEPGYLFVLCTLVPKVTYATGIDRKLIRYRTNSRTDLANPILQNTGNEPIFQAELCSDLAFAPGNSGITGDIFGYQERYSDWKTHDDELHGLLRERDIKWSGTSGYSTNVGSLQSFALQSSFGLTNIPQISNAFLQIPTTYLDNVSAVEGDISKYGCWIDSYFDFKVSMPLARYSLSLIHI